MATLKQRLHRKNSSGTYDTIHLETSADCITGTLGVAHGGTGKASWSANRLMYASASTTLNQLAFPTTAGSVLCQGTSGAPYWAAPPPGFVKLGERTITTLSGTAANFVDCSGYSVILQTLTGTMKNTRPLAGSSKNSAICLGDNLENDVVYFSNTPVGTYTINASQMLCRRNYHSNHDPDQWQFYMNGGITAGTENTVTQVVFGSIVSATNFTGSLVQRVYGLKL